MGELIRLPTARTVRRGGTIAGRSGQLLAFRRPARTVPGMDAHHDDHLVFLTCRDSEGTPVDFAAVVAGVFDGELQPDDYTVTLADARPTPEQ